MNKLLLCFMVFLLFSCGKNNNSYIIKTDAANKNQETINETINNNESNYPEQIINNETQFTGTNINIFEMDLSMFKINKGEVTLKYSVSDIINVHTGIGDGEMPYAAVTENFIINNGSSIRVILKKDTDPEKKYHITARGGTNEYETELPPLRKIDSYRTAGEFFGYYTDVDFENKPWLNNSADLDVWRIIVKTDSEELINDELICYNFTNIFYENLDRTPFSRNNLIFAGINKEYKYRFNTHDADILVIYVYIEIFEPYYGSIYRPVLYFLPEKNNEQYTDINISWNSDELKGTYHIGKYKLDALPVKERTFPVFDRVIIR